MHFVGAINSNASEHTWPSPRTCIANQRDPHEQANVFVADAHSIEVEGLHAH